MDPILSARDLVVRKGASALNFDVYKGLSLLVTERESGASTVSMALAGRFSPASGTITVSQSRGTNASSTRERFRVVALAGVSLIDSLERSVSVGETIREQVAWAQSFFRRIPKRILTHSFVEPWLEPLGLSTLDPALPVGDLSTLERMRLRILLALIARHEAELLIVDDPDQLRSNQQRSELLASLLSLSEYLPVLVTTVNPAAPDAANLIDLRNSSASLNNEGATP